jgi:hypothetical protein
VYLQSSRLKKWTAKLGSFPRRFPSAGGIFQIALPENQPYTMHYDGHKNRIDRIVRPYEIEVMEKEVFPEGIFSDNTISLE